VALTLLREAGHRIGYAVFSDLRATSVPAVGSLALSASCGSDRGMAATYQTHTA
jgi:hypothetical protein